MKPFISIIIPVYNAEKYVKDAIESVLAQDYVNMEIICVNDGSTDNSLQVLKSYEGVVQTVNSEKNGGIGDARNRGIKLAKGEYIAFIDADDVWEAGKLRAQLDFLESHPDVDMCFTYMKCFISPELPDEVKNIRYCNPDPVAGCVASAALIKSESFKRVGLFDPVWRVGEFIDWLAKAQDVGLKVGVLKDVLVHRRIHDTNTGIRERSSHGDYIKIVRESLRRKKEK